MVTEDSLQALQTELARLAKAQFKATTLLETSREAGQRTNDALARELASLQKAVQDLRTDLRRQAALDFLSVVDGLDAALEDLARRPWWRRWSADRRGLELVLRKAEAALERLGARPVEAAGRPFDPRLHRAVETQRGQGPPTVLRVETRGWTFGEEVLRAAAVVVTAGPEES